MGKVRSRSLTFASSRGTARQSRISYFLEEITMLSFDPDKTISKEKKQTCKIILDTAGYADARRVTRHIYRVLVGNNPTREIQSLKQYESWAGEKIESLYTEEARRESGG